MPRLPQFKVPNTRTGALGLTAGLAALGFLIGLAILVLAPAARSGTGIFAYFSRPRVVDVHGRGLPKALAAPRDERPELWMTPVATRAFPSEARLGEVGAAITGRYDPRLEQRVIALPPIRDAIGRPVASVVVSLGGVDDPDVPGPLRPDTSEPNQITVAALLPGSTEASACVLALVRERLEAIGAVGVARLEECRAGTLRLPNEAGVAFAVQYSPLPNHRTRDGTWRAGGVLGITDVRVSLTALPG